MQILKRTVSIFLAIVMSLALCIPTFAASNLESGLSVRSISSTEESANIEYCLTTDGKTRLYNESATIIGDKIVAVSSFVELDDTGEPIDTTRQSKTWEIPIVINESDILTRADDCNWKEHEMTISMAGVQMTAISIGTLLSAVTGMGLGAAISAGASILAFYVGLGYGEIPDELYFKGEMCVSHSPSGKIYNRYRGNIYGDSAHTQLIVEDLSWSERWGH